MQITVNGEELALSAQVCVQELLEIQQVKMAQYVTVQINDELVDREDFGVTIIKDGDVIEFLYFMGGGRS